MHDATRTASSCAMVRIPFCVQSDIRSDMLKHNRLNKRVHGLRGVSLNTCDVARRLEIGLCNANVGRRALVVATLARVRGLGMYAIACSPQNCRTPNLSSLSRKPHANRLALLEVNMVDQVQVAARSEFLALHVHFPHSHQPADTPAISSAIPAGVPSGLLSGA